jgi:hypothetical protein
MSAGNKPAKNLTGHVVKKGGELNSGSQGCKATSNIVAHAEATAQIVTTALKWANHVDGDFHAGGYRRLRVMTMGVASAHGNHAKPKAKNILTHE